MRIQDPTDPRWHAEQVEWYRQKHGRHPSLGWSLPRLDPAMRAAGIPIEYDPSPEPVRNPFVKWTDEHRAQARRENSIHYRESLDKAARLAEAIANERRCTDDRNDQVPPVREHAPSEEARYEGRLPVEVLLDQVQEENAEARLEGGGAVHGLREPTTRRGTPDLPDLHRLEEAIGSQTRQSEADQVPTVRNQRRPARETRQEGDLLQRPMPNAGIAAQPESPRTKPKPTEKEPRSRAPSMLDLFD